MEASCSTTPVSGRNRTGKPLDEENDEMEQISDLEVEGPDFEVSRAASLRDLIELEKNFQELRDALYQERTQQINRRLAELNEGCAIDYRRKVAALEESFRVRQDIAEIQKRLQLEELEKFVEIAEISTNQDFVANRISLFDQLKEDLEWKITKLKADKHSADVNLAIWMMDSADRFPSESGKRVVGQGKTAATKKKANRRPVTVTGPFIVYMLKEEEIEEDYDAIRRAAIESDLYEHNIFH